jgi:hypothetical protein
MNVEIYANARDISKPDVTLLVQKIREWELTTKRAQIDRFIFKTDPDIGMEETAELLNKIFPKFENIWTVPLKQTGTLRLGTRAVKVDGQVVGIVQEIVLSVEGAGETEMKLLTEAIELVFCKLRQTGNIYKGVRLEIGDQPYVVTRNGEAFDPAPSVKVWNHSGGQFSWGYWGSGCAQLALAILLAEGLPADRALRLHQSFKEAFVATWGDTWVLTAEEIAAWVQAQEK